MNISKYWNKLLKNVIDETPYFFHRKDYIIKKSSEHQFTDIELKNLSDFYRQKYRVNKSNITQFITLLDFKRYFNLKIELITIYSITSEKIIGSIISFVIPVNVSNKITGTKDFPYTSFLVIDEKYRGKGFGMALIQESLKMLHDIGCLGAYFINNVPRGNNFIKLFTWFYPFNFSKIRSNGFLYPTGYENNFQLNYDERIEKVNENNNGYQFYHDYLRKENQKRNIFYFSPSLIYWNKWIEIFDTYLVYKNDKIIGLFSIDINILYKNNYLNQGNLLICIGEQPETINASITIARKKFDLLIIHELGDITFQLLKSIFAQGLYTNYINFYNKNSEITSNNFYLPII